jgi:hypothetical protein
MNNDKPIITITGMPRWNYFQWFLLGIYLLEEEGKVELRFKTDFMTKVSTLTNSKYVLGWHRYLHAADNYNLDGYIDWKGKRKYFTIDSADAPFLFDSQKLNDVDTYFKMQCPKEYKERGFRLTDEVWIPWCDHAHVDSSMTLTQRGERKLCANLEQHLDKVKPLMVGPRCLARGNSKNALIAAYKNYLSSQANEKIKKMMCYFGNSAGPIPSKNVTNPDWDWEADIIGYYADKLNHPNEKRYRATKILQSLGADYDGRLITEGYSDTGNLVQHPDLVVPLPAFCDHVSHFQYNLNISGYRMSIPNRFIESFLVGTAIMTDKLAIKWYKPFGKEVVETVPMGYLPNDKVNWSQFETDIQNLPTVSKEDVIKEYNDKWEPRVVAKYIIDSVIGN